MHIMHYQIAPSFLIQVDIHYRMYSVRNSLNVVVLLLRNYWAAGVRHGILHDAWCLPAQVVVIVS